MKQNNIKHLGQIISEKYILPKHLNISSRQVNYWKNKSILPFLEKDKHGKMDIPQAVWLFVINELSSIGIDSNRLSKLSYDVWGKPKQEKYADKTIQYHISKKTNRLDDISIIQLKENLKDELLMEALRMEINPFTDAIKASLSSDKTPSSLLYFPNTCKHTFMVGDLNTPLKLNNLLHQETAISIPFLKLLAKVVSFDFETTKGDLSYLTQIENQIRDIVIFKRPKYIELVMDNSKLKPLIITEQHKRASQLADFFLCNKLPKNSKLLIEVRSQDNYKLTLITK